MSTRMQQRRGTAAQWVSRNEGRGPILNAGEIGFEIDTNKFKIGDGINHWADLTYFIDEDSASGSGSGSMSIEQVAANGTATETYSNITTLQFDEDSGFDVTSPTSGVAKVAMNSTFKYWEVDGVQKLTAVGLDTVNFISGTGIDISANGNSDPQSVTIAADFSGLATESYVDTALGSVTVDLSTAAGAYIDWNSGTSQLDVNSASLFSSPTFTTQLTLDGTGDFTLSSDSGIIFNPTTKTYIGSATSANEIATKSYVDTSVGNVTVDLSTSAGTGLDWNSLTSQFDIDNTVATTSYVDTAVGNAGGGLPSQTGNAHKVLTTDGTNASWGPVVVNSGTNLFIGTYPGGW